MKKFKIGEFFVYNVLIKTFGLLVIVIGLIFLDSKIFNQYAFYLTLINLLLFATNGSINNSLDFIRLIKKQEAGADLKVLGTVTILPFALIYAYSTGQLKPLLFFISGVLVVVHPLNQEYLFKGEKYNQFQNKILKFLFFNALLLVLSGILKFPLYIYFILLTIFSIPFSYSYLIQLKNLNAPRLTFLIKGSLLMKFFGLLIINLANYLYINLDNLIIFAINLKTEVQNNFYVWTRYFSIFIALSATGSEYVYNRVFITGKTNCLDSRFEKVYIGISMLLYILSWISLKTILFLGIEVPFIEIENYFSFYISSIPALFIGPLFGFNLLTLNKTKVLLLITILSVILNFVLFSILYFNKIIQSPALIISISAAFTKVFNETVLILLNLKFKVIKTQTVLLLLFLIIFPLILELSWITL